MQEMDEIIDEIIKLGLDDNEIELLFKKLKLVRKVNSLENVEEHFEKLENYLKNIVEKGIDNVENIFVTKKENTDKKGKYPF